MAEIGSTDDDRESLDMARDGIEPPTRGFSVPKWWWNYVSPTVVN
jgi:hypothetical protein